MTAAFLLLCVWPGNVTHRGETCLPLSADSELTHKQRAPRPPISTRVDRASADETPNCHPVDRESFELVHLSSSIVSSDLCCARYLRLPCQTLYLRISIAFCFVLLSLVLDLSIRVHPILVRVSPPGPSSSR